MTNIQKSKTAAVITWVVIMGYYLHFYFSMHTVVIFAAALVYIFICVFYTKNSNSYGVIANNLVNMTGVSITVILLWRIFSLYTDNYGIGRIWVRFFSDLGAALLALSINIAMLFVIIGFFLPLIVKGLEAHPLKQFLFRYLPSAVCFAIAILSISREWTGVLEYTAVCLLYFYSFSFTKLGGSKNPKAGAFWYLLFSSLYVLFEVPGRFVIMRLGLEDYFLKNVIPWQGVLLVSLTLAAGFAFIYKTEGRTCDAFSYCTSFCILPVLYVFSLFYVGYWWILLVVFIAAVMSMNIMLCPSVIRRSGTSPAVRWASIPILCSAVIFLLFEAHYGKLLLGVTAVAAVAFAYCILKDPKKKKSDAETNVRTYIVLIAMAAAVFLSRLWVERRDTKNFITYFIILGCFILFILIQNFNSKLFRNQKSVKVILRVSVILFAVLSIVLSSHGGSSIKIRPDGQNSKVIVEINANGKSNSIASVEYRWFENRFTIQNMTMLQGKDFSGQLLSPTGQEVALPSDTGYLEVTVKDGSGVITTAGIWQHNISAVS